MASHYLHTCATQMAERSHVMRHWRIRKLGHDLTRRFVREDKATWSAFRFTKVRRAEQGLCRDRDVVYGHLRYLLRELRKRPDQPHAALRLGFALALAWHEKRLTMREIEHLIETRRSNTNQKSARPARPRTRRRTS